MVVFSPLLISPKFMMQSFARDVGSCSSIRESSCMLQFCVTRCCYFLYNRPPRTIILIHTRSTILSSVLEFFIGPRLSFILRCSNLSFLFGILHQYFVRIYIFSHACHISTHLIHLNLVVRIQFDQQFKWFSLSLRNFLQPSERYE
jgi:hypothetical protein